LKIVGGINQTGDTTDAVELLFMNQFESLGWISGKHFALINYRKLFPNVIAFHAIT
jgi:hypothetical protein